MTEKSKPKERRSFRFSDVTVFRLNHITFKNGNRSMTHTLEKLIDNEYLRVKNAEKKV